MSADETTAPILVGVVTAAHGLRGEVKIEIHSDVPGRFDSGSELWLAARDGDRRRVTVASSRSIRGGAIVRFDGCDDRDRALALRGARLEVERSEVPAAPPGQYYWFELVGCRCVDRRDGELGEVTAVVEDGGGILLEIRDGERTLMVPFVEAFLDAVDVERREIRLALPPGLVEICASRS